MSEIDTEAPPETPPEVPETSAEVQSPADNEANLIDEPDPTDDYRFDGADYDGEALAQAYGPDEVAGHGFGDMDTLEARANETADTASQKEGEDAEAQKTVAGTNETAANKDVALEDAETKVNNASEEERPVAEQKRDVAAGEAKTAHGEASAAETAQSGTASEAKAAQGLSEEAKANVAAEAAKLKEAGLSDSASAGGGERPTQFGGSPKKVRSLQ